MAHRHTIHWETFEYDYVPKSADWYWALWIIVISLSATSIILGNILLAILLVISAFTFSLFSVKKPRVINCEINEHGVLIDRRTLYIYSEIESFWVEEAVHHHTPRVLIKSRRTFAPLIVVPLGQVEPELARQALLAHVTEEELHEPLSQLIMEYLGF